MERLHLRLVPGLCTALCAVAGATLFVSALDGELYWFGRNAALRIGGPAFLLGFLFFPVTARSLASRPLFALRALVAAGAATAVHRALLSSCRARGECSMAVWPTAWGEGPFGVDPSVWLAALALGGAAALAWAAQPAMLRFATRGRDAPSPCARESSSRASRG